MWRELYPAGIHYLIGQILGSAVLLWLTGHVGNAQERYYSYTLVITGLTGVLVMFPAVYFYRKDRIGRLIGGLTSVEEQRLSIPEMLLLLAAGAGFAQYANVLVAILQNWISSSYGETMTKITSGKSLFMMIFWMGIIAPVAEEMIFRWLIYLRLRDHFSVLFSAVISAALPDELRSLFPGEHLLVRSLSNNNRVVMMVLADQDGEPFSETSVQAFGKTAQCIEKALNTFTTRGR